VGGGGSLCLHRRYCFCKGVERIGGVLAMAIFLLQPLSFGGSLPTHRGTIWRTGYPVLEGIALAFFHCVFFPLSFYISFPLYSLFLNCSFENVEERV